MGQFDITQLSVTPRLVLAEFDRRKIPYDIVSTGKQHACITYRDESGAQRYLQNVVTDTTSAAAVRIADSKAATYVVAKRLAVPVPATIAYENKAQAEAFLTEYETIVVKPVDAAHGHGVTTGVTFAAQLQTAIQHAQRYTEQVLLQQQINGDDIRILYVGGVFCAAVQRLPARVIGDGRHTLAELINAENARNERGEGYTKPLTIIPIDRAKEFLGDRYDSEVPAPGQVVSVIGTANIGSGGTAIALADTRLRHVIADGERLVQELRMDVCGVDFIINSSGQHYLIEINASPTLGMHHYPHKGSAVDAAKRVVDVAVMGRR